MGPSVVIKTNAYGLQIRLDSELPFDQLLEEVGRKFHDAARFFRNAQMAVTFQGRTLSSDEEYQLVSVITENAQLQIVCLVDESRESSEYYKEALTRALAQQDERALVYRGTVTNGETVTSDTDLVILGDVNPGAQVSAAGSIIVLGCVMGSAAAGCAGKRDSFVAAMILKPSILRIADKAARSAITKRIDSGDYAIEPKIAMIRDEHIVLEKLKGNVFRLLDEQPSKE